jgi:hypothetical protein
MGVCNFMLTVLKLKSIIANLGDDMPVLIATEPEHADHINSIGITYVGLRRWSEIVVSGVAEIEAVEALIVSTHPGEQQEFQ